MAAHTNTACPTWGEYWATVGNEEFLTAQALLELSPTVRAHAAGWLRWQHDDVRDDDGTVLFAEQWPDLDWDGWAAELEANGGPFSSTETRLAEVVAALTTGGPVRLVGVLDLMGSWEVDVWRILTEWGTGGNNRDRAGRATVTTRPAHRGRVGGGR